MIDPEAPLEPPRGSFLGNVNVVMLTYLLDGMLAFGTGIVIARALGPEGRGAYGLFVLASALGQLILGFGVGNAAIYYLNRREVSLRDVVTAAHVVVIASVVVCAIVVAAVAPWAGDRVFGAGITPWLLVATAPLLLWWNLMRLILQALDRFVDLGVLTIGQQLILLMIVGTLAATADPGRTAIAASLAIATGAMAVFALFRVGVENIDLGRIVRPRFDTLRRLAGFGLQGETGNILQLLNYRLNQYIVRAYVGLAGVGIYAVGASVTEAIFVMANAVALVLMPRLTADPEEAHWMAPVACRNTMLVAAVGAVVLAAAAPVVVPLAFGDAYRDSVEALWLLLPGAVALSGAKVITSYIFSRGRPMVNTAITAASLTVTVAADFALIPAFGVNGAAIASSLAYIVHLAAALFVYQRMSGRPAHVALIPRLEDARLYADAARTMLARLTRRPALGTDG